jgi:hypothetical protein
VLPYLKTDNGSSQSGGETPLSRNAKNSEDYGMLHAFCRRKSGLYKRYLGHREPGEKRVCEEDEITAHQGSFELGVSLVLSIES